MFCYYLNIADLSIEIETPVPIVFRNCLQPFRKKKGIRPDLVYRISSRQVQNTDTIVSKGEYTVAKKEDRDVRVKKMFQNGQVHVTCLFEEEPGIYNLYIPREWLAGDRLFENENILDFLALENGFLMNQAFLLHASLVAWRGKGIVFTAPSGTGKSTQADLWHQYESAEIYNGDRTVIRKKGKNYYGYGSPYAGSSGIYRDQTVPVQGIIVLDQAPVEHIKQLKGNAAFVPLYRETLMNAWNGKYMEAMTDILKDVVTNIPIYHLECRPDREAVELLKKTLKVTEKGN